MAVHPLVTPSDLARTYNPRSYSDGWELVEDYQRVLEYTGRKPNAGSQAVASKLDLPRGRVRPWIDDGTIPDAVRGIQVAEARGWLPLEETTPMFEPMNKLVAWACSRGTIKPDSFTPYFIVRSETDRERLFAIVDELGVEMAEHRTDDTRRSTEWRPREGGTVLGRILWLLGAPSDDEILDTTPAYLSEVSKDAQREFLRVYLENRGKHWEFNDRWIVEHKNRPAFYRRSLATLFRTLGADSEVHEDSISIDNEFVSGLLADG